MRKLQVVLVRIVALVVGWFVVFDIQFLVQEFLAKQYDVVRTGDLILRPYLYAVLRIAPFLFAPALVSDFSTESFWLILIACLFLPVLAIVFFEYARKTKPLGIVVLFYMFVPSILFLAVSYAIQYAFPL